MPVTRTSLNGGVYDISAKSSRIAGGAAVSQATDRTTAVTINTEIGQITTQTTSIAAGGEASFTVNNNKVALIDVVLASIATSPDADSVMDVTVTAIAAGSFELPLSNLHVSAADTGAIVINFAVIHAAI